MSNKATPRSAYMSRRTPQSQIFDLNLTNTDSRNRTPLSYSESPDLVKVIDIHHLPTRKEVFPNTSDFATQPLCPEVTCHRKDCLDRKFRAIKNTQKSSPNVRVVSPRKVDIVLESEGASSSVRRQPGIHSFKKIAYRSSTEKDMLKQFKQLEQARKDLKSRKSQMNRPISLSVNMVKSAHFNRSGRQYNPQKSQLYSEVRGKISKRYNSMFRKYADNCVEEMKTRQDFLKDLCRATRITSQKVRGSEQ